jgi:hypothetical protein
MYVCVVPAHHARLEAAPPGGLSQREGGQAVEEGGDTAVLDAPPALARLHFMPLELPVVCVCESCPTQQRQALRGVYVSYV